MKLQPYLFFDGRCDEAIAFYQQALGAQVVSVMRFGDHPQPPDASGGCAGDMARIRPEHVMHGELRIGDDVVMVSDGMAGGAPRFEGISLSLSVPALEQGRRWFAALGEGGQVQVPLAPTFFSPGFGMVADRFGVSWMVVVADGEASVRTDG